MKHHMPPHAGGYNREGSWRTASEQTTASEVITISYSAAQGTRKARHLHLRWSIRLCRHASCPRKLESSAGDFAGASTCGDMEAAQYHPLSSERDGRNGHKSKSGQEHT